MGIVRSYLVILILVTSSSSAQETNGNLDPDSIPLITEVISNWESTLLKCESGEMTFEVEWSGADSAEVRYKGIVGWQFPLIRWEYLLTLRLEDGESTTSCVLIDTPQEIITHDLGSRQVYRAKNRCRGYDRVLELAPWQSWFKYDGQVSWSEILDLKKLDSLSGRKVRADRRKDAIAIAFESDDGTLISRFNPANGCLLSYTPEVPASSKLPCRSGELHWVQINDVPFPRSIELYEWIPSKGKPSKPNLCLKTADHRIGTRWTPADFTYESIDLTKVDVITEYFPGNKKPVVHRYRKGKVDDTQSLHTLGESISNVGFARGPN